MKATPSFKRADASCRTAADVRLGRSMRIWRVYHHEAAAAVAAMATSASATPSSRNQ